MFSKAVSFISQQSYADGSRLGVPPKSGRLICTSLATTEQSDVKSIRNFLARLQFHLKQIVEKWLSACCSASGVEACHVQCRLSQNVEIPLWKFCSILLSHLHRFSILSHHFRRHQPPWHTCRKWFEHKWEVPSARKFTFDSWDVQWLLARTDIIRLTHNKRNLYEVGRWAKFDWSNSVISKEQQINHNKMEIDINKCYWRLVSRQKSICSVFVIQLVGCYAWLCK